MTSIVEAADHASAQRYVPMCEYWRCTRHPKHEACAESAEAGYIVTIPLCAAETDCWESDPNDPGRCINFRKAGAR